MEGHGLFRDRIAGTLKAAYGDGLLSEATLSHRLDVLWASHLVDPSGLLGDLTLRPAGWWRGSRLREAVRDALAGRRRRRRPPAPPVLLALDWAGVAEELLVGRHLSCDVVLDDLSVSRRHARLHFRDGHWVLQDLESTNGTLVNGAPVVRCELRSGDELQLGRLRLLVDWDSSGRPAGARRRAIDSACAIR